MSNVELLAVRNSSMSKSERREFLEEMARHIQNLIKKENDELTLKAVFEKTTSHFARTRAEVGEAVSYGAERRYFHVDSKSRILEA